MTPEQIQTKLAENGWTQRALAADLDPPVSAMTISKVIHRIIVSSRVMRAIAEKIGEDHRAVFPEYFLQPPKRSTSKVH
jgi:lambda repressor-like predicted transcriptional regulator